VDSDRGGETPAHGELAYVGSAAGLERSLVPRTGIPCWFFPMAPPSSPRGLLLLSIATTRCLLLMTRVRPRVAFATGGYVSAPVVLAAWLLRVPIVLFLPDIVPGKAVTWLAPLARRIAVSVTEAVHYLPARKTVVTGYPVRSAFRQISRHDARRRFALPDHDPVVCVFGGSQGARSINQAIGRHLPRLLVACHLLHICGEHRLPEAESQAANLDPEQRSRYHLFPYLHDDDMAAALLAADLVLCRSGASTLGELPAAGVPAILVPLPEQAVHQRENAEYLAGQGAAVIISDAELGAHVDAAILDILGDTNRLARMAAAARRLDHPNAAACIADLIHQEAG
jgi:UDP-N-acetylglucosamine--N-acetylmuramyl-(pentapeptide) pyrophosphoryl-undecaprenol N-acetylglucosamine transferase